MSDARPGPRRVGVIGLGIMGSSIARNLVEAGFHVTGFDPDPACRAASAGEGVAIADSGGAVASGAEVLLSSLPSDAALEVTVDAVLAEAAAGRITSGQPWLELSTLSIDCKQRSHDRLAQHGLRLLDCPISGTGAQARTRDLVVYGSGAPAEWEGCRDVIAGFARSAAHVGEFGNGMRLKFIANLLVAVHNVATAEALALAGRAGLDLAQACELLGAGAAGSRILQLRGPMMARGVFEPATMKLDLWQKDLRLIESFARAEGARTPLFDATLPLYAAALDAGLAKQDTAAVFRVLTEDPR